MTTVSIIGTAGRSHQDPTITMYNKMISSAIRYLQSLSGEIILVSGGAAWSDHVAVHLYLNRQQYALPILGLRLYLPCAFDLITKRYVDTGSSDWRVNPGRISNIYHQQFSNAIGRNSLDELAHVIQDDHVYIEVFNGFHARNSRVAQSEYILAFTWGQNEPEDGGTLDTWNKAKHAKRTHVNLATL